MANSSSALQNIAADFMGFIADFGSMLANTIAIKPANMVNLITIVNRSADDIKAKSEANV